MILSSSAVHTAANSPPVGPTPRTASANPFVITAESCITSVCGQKKVFMMKIISVTVHFVNMMVESAVFFKEAHSHITKNHCFYHMICNKSFKEESLFQT